MLINRFFTLFFFDKDESAGGASGGQAAATPTPNDPKGETPGEEPFDKERAMATINKLREIEKAHDKLVKAEEARKREQMTESDRVKAEKLDLETKLSQTQTKMKQTLASALVIKAAAKAGFNDPDDAWNMLKETLTISDEGEVDGLEKALSKLVEAKPYLIRQAGGGSTPTPPPPGKQPSPGNPGQTPGLTMEAISKMSQQEIAKLWNDPAFQKELEAAQKRG